jgi:adenylyltransferase/sulfurtransferase
MLTKEEKRKYIKQIMLSDVGSIGQEKIRSAKVAIVGCGGLGCPTLLYLSAAGIGTIGIIDFDTVNITNLHRQILFGNKDVGNKKVQVAKEKINAMHPEVNIIIHDEMIQEKNATELLSVYDIVIDGCDNFETRYIVNDACVLLGKSLIYGSIFAHEGQMALFNVQGSKNLRDIFPEAPNAEDVPDCSENGVLGTVPGIIGNLMANECLKLILELSTLQNKFLLIDTKTLSMNIFQY